MKIEGVAIVHHDTPELLARALRRLAEVAPATPVAVLDASADGAPARAAADVHPRARVVPVPNHSYAAAVNRAIKELPRELIAVMNADVLVGDHTLDALARPFVDPDVALVGPLGRTPGGRLQDLGLPYRLVTRRVEGRGSHAAVDAPWLSGFLLAVRRAAAYDVGGMDAGLRFFNEDLDWSFRLRRAGWRCRLVGAEVLHVGGAATPSAGRFLAEGLRGGMRIVERHRDPLRREAQRWAVALVATLRSRVGPSDDRRTWAAVARMMRLGRYDVSSFGPTLGDDAPGFPDTWPPAVDG